MKLTCTQVLEGHEGRVWCCKWNPSGTLLATCGEDTNIRLWGRDADGDKWILKSILTEGHTRTIRYVSWSPCGRYLASASFDGTVAVWDKKGRDGDASNQFECNATLEGHENEVKAVSWSPSGHFLATCSRDKSVWVWDVDEEEGGGDNEYMCAAVLQAHSQDVKRVCWHPNEDVLASCSYDNKIKFYKEDGDEWSCSDTLTSHESTVWAVAFDASGKRLASCSEDRTVKIWEEYVDGDGAKRRAAWKCCCTLSGAHERAVYDVDWCAASGLVATASADNGVRIFREEAGGKSPAGETSFRTVASKLDAHTQDVNGVAWNPRPPSDAKDRLLLASCSDDGTVKLWEVQVEADDDAVD